MSEKRTIRWGLIGCGDISRRRVAPAFRELKSCHLLAVNRADPQQLESFAQEFEAEKTYSDWRDLVADPDIQAVYIATPVYLHAEMTQEAAKAGKHVLCEKPMAMSDTECRNMMNACRENRVCLGIAYYRHHYPVIQRIREIIHERLIGNVMLIQINAFSPFDRRPGEPRYWLLEKDKSGGGPMMDFGCHRIEVMLDLLGPVDRVRADTDNLKYKRSVEDTAIAHFKFSSGARGILTVTHTVPVGQDTLDLYGTEGSVHVPVLNKGFLRLKTPEKETKETWPPHANLHLPLIEDFTRAILDRREPAVSGETGFAVNQILTKIYSNSF